MKKICFKYWPRENKEDDFFKKTLKKFDCKIVSEKEAEVMFFSIFDGSNRKIPNVSFNGVKVFWTGENVKVNMNNCDYAFGFDYMEKKNYLRLPDLLKGKNYSPKKILASKKRFCNYIYSKNAPERVALFHALDQYKRIDAPGKSMNNSMPLPPSKIIKTTKMIQKVEKAIGNYSISSLLSRHVGNWRENVINYQKDYKFSIAFENSLGVGYTTEKIYHPMLANSIPIYWGNEEISRDFNTKSFVNYHDYNDLKKVVDVIIELDQNDKKYLKMLKEPWLKGNKLNKWMDLKKIEKQFERILKLEINSE